MADGQIKFDVLVSKEQAEQAWNALNAKMAQVQGTGAGITAALKQTNEELSRAKIGSDAFNFLAQKAKTLETELKRMENAVLLATGGTKKLDMAVKGARMANMDFNRVIQDAPYFFQSWQMGIMSVGNNIDQFGASIKRLREETGSWKGAIGSFMGGFGGFSGFLSLLSLGISGITAYSLATRDAGKETKKTADYTKEYKDQLQGLLDKFNEFEKKAQDPSTLMRGASKLNFLGEQRDYLQASITQANALIAAYKKSGNFDAATKLSLGKQKYSELLKKVNEEILQIEAAFNNVKMDHIKNLNDFNEKSLDQRMDNEKDFYMGLSELSQGRLDFEKKMFNEEVAAWRKAGYDKIEIDKMVMEKRQEFAQRQRVINAQTAPVNALGIDKYAPPIIKGVNMFPYDNSRQPDLFNNLEQQQRQVIEDNKIFYELSQSFGDLFADAGMEAFDKIFGEANSLLEKFLANFANGLLNVASNNLAKNVFGELLGLLPGGSLLGELFKSTNGKQQINVFVGDELLVQKTVTPTTVGNAIEVGKRLRVAV